MVMILSGGNVNELYFSPPHSGSALDFQPPAPSLYGGSSLVTCPLYRGRSATNSAWTTYIVLLKDTSAG